MRPVNLIPPEDRRGDRAPLRRGSLSYVIVAGLAAALIGVTLVALTNNSIADRKNEIVALEAREAAAQERAERLAAFAEFSVVSDARASTVASLAQSRFDWHRVLKELSLVIPEDVALTSLTGNVSPEVGVGEDSKLREGVTGPALSLMGCAEDQDAVAGFLQDLRDIDGVTRVGVATSAVGEKASGGGESEACPPESGLPVFDIVAVFDEVAVAPATAAAATAPAVPTAAAPGAATGESAVDDASARQQESRDSIERQSDQARTAANLVPGTAR